MSTTEPTPPVLPDAHAHAASLRSIRIGYLLGALGALLFSSKGVIIKLAYEEGVDAETLLGMRLALALPIYLAIGGWSLWDRARQGRGLPSGRLVIGAALVGIIGYYIASYADFLGLQYISAQFERMILFTYPLFVVLIGALFFRQPAQRAVLVAIAIAYAGIALIFAGRVQTFGSDVAIGAGFVLIAALSFALYQLLAKPLIGQVGPRLFTCIAMTAAAAVSIGQFFLTHSVGEVTLTESAFWYVVLLAGAATVAPSFLLAAALHRISAQANATIGMLSPIATIILAWFVLDERMSAIDFAGVALVLAGVGWMSLRDTGKAPSRDDRIAGGQRPT